MGCVGENNPPSDNPAQGDTLFASRIATIGVVDGPDEYMFGDISSVAVAGSHIYIADRLGSTVRAYDLDGQFISQIGAEGEGPGEFLWPDDLSLDPAGRLYVRDARRITVLAPSIAGGVPDSSVRTIQKPCGGGSVRSRTDGTLYYCPGARYGETNHFYYVVLDSAGLTGDTVRVPPMPTAAFLPSAIVRLGTDGLMLQGVNRAPFEPAASWDITQAGSVIAARGDHYEVIEVDASGDTSWILHRPEDPRPVSAAEARDSARVFRARLDSIPVPLDRVMRMSDAARTGTLPEVVPAILAVHVAAGQAWLKRWPPPEVSDRTVFDVIDADGAFLHSIVVPATLLDTPSPYVSAETVAGVVRDAATGVQTVVIFDVPLR